MAGRSTLLKAVAARTLAARRAETKSEKRPPRETRRAVLIRCSLSLSLFKRTFKHFSVCTNASDWCMRECLLFCCCDCWHAGGSRVWDGARGGWESLSRRRRLRASRSLPSLGPVRRQVRCLLTLRVQLRSRCSAAILAALKCRPSTNQRRPEPPPRSLRHAAPGRPRVGRTGAHFVLGNNELLGIASNAFKTPAIAKCASGFGIIFSHSNIPDGEEMQKFVANS